MLYFTGKTFWKNKVGLLFIVSQCRGSFWYWKRNLSMAAKGIWVFPRDRMQKGPQLWQNHPSIDLEARKGIINRRLGIDLEPVISTFWFALPAGETVTSVISESCAYPKNLKSSFWEKWQLRRCQIINQWISNDLEAVHTCWVLHHQLRWARPQEGGNEIVCAALSAPFIWYWVYHIQVGTTNTNTIKCTCLQEQCIMWLYKLILQKG